MIEMKLFYTICIILYAVLAYNLKSVKLDEIF